MPTVECGKCKKGYEVKKIVQGRRHRCHGCVKTSFGSKSREWLPPLTIGIRLKITQETLRAYVASGDVRTRPFGPSYVVSVADLKAKIKASRHPRTGTSKNAAVLIATERQRLYKLNIKGDK